MADCCIVLWMLQISDFCLPSPPPPSQIVCEFNCRNIVDMFETKSCKLFTNEYPRNRFSQTLVLKSAKILPPYPDFDEIGQL
jgi:hypothetical protein